jgi:phosphonatase-like hydrolase
VTRRDAMQLPALAVLDMAGTTIEDSGQVPEAFTTVLRRQGIAVDEAQLAALRGASKRDAIRHFVTISGGDGVEARTDKIYGEFRSHLSDLFNSGGVKPVEGARAAIDWLRANGVAVALNTGFDRGIVDLLLDAVDWRTAVDAVVCGDDVVNGRPAPDLIFAAMKRTGVTDARRVIAVGDTVLDLRAGRNAGAGCVVGVLSGAHSRERLEAEPHDRLIASVAELPGLVKVHLLNP